MNFNSSFLGQAQTAAEGIIPHNFDEAPYNVNVNGGADNCGQGVSLGYHIERTPVRLSSIDNTLSVSTELRYWIRGRARYPCPGKPWPRPLIYGSCGVGEPLRRIALSIAVTVGSPDAAKNPMITSTITDLHPIDRCRVTKLNKDVTDAVTNAARAAIAKSLDSLDQRLTQIK